MNLMWCVVWCFFVMQLLLHTWCDVVSGVSKTLNILGYVVKSSSLEKSVSESIWNWHIIWYYMMYVYDMYVVYISYYPFQSFFSVGFQLKPSFPSQCFLKKANFSLPCCRPWTGKAVHIWMMLLEISRLGTHRLTQLRTSWTNIRGSHGDVFKCIPWRIPMGRVWYICLHVHGWFLW